MSKFVPIVIALGLGALGLAPVYNAIKNPTPHVKKTNAAPTALGQNATATEKVSYFAGYQLAQQLPANLNSGAFFAGFQDNREAKPSRFTDNEVREAFVAFEQEGRPKTPSAEQNAAFLAKHAKQPNVKTTASGLQYIIDIEGTGKSPTAQSKVVVNYEGRLIDGTIFDSSIKMGKPAEFVLGQVIPGWQEGLKLMKEGGKATFVIPPELAYGAQGVGQIPPNSILLFSVELVKVE